MHSDKHPGLQKHSVGELYPFIIYAYGDGTWQWVNHELKWAARRMSSQAAVEHSARVVRRLVSQLQGPAVPVRRHFEKCYRLFTSELRQPEGPTVEEISYQHNPFPVSKRLDQNSLVPEAAVYRARFKDGSIRWLMAADVSKILESNGEMPTSLRKFVEEK